ncbi:MAG: branched-chain-amino acid aminotransferase [Proteobacteria bacterium]|nr:branched-chain-amino acid aminotransferase [Pseudomonadota bacterium]
MTFTCSIDGQITSSNEARISVLDRGFLYGDSVYEVVRTYNGKPFAMSRHLERLDRSAKHLAIELPSRSQLKEQVGETLRAANNDESYCRIIVTRGSGPLTLDPTKATNPITVILVKEYEPFPEWMYTKGIRLAIPSVRRTSKEALDPAIKSGNYLNSVLALGEAKKRGFDDAVMLDKEGRVTESTSSNLFTVLGGELYTPALEAGLLAGVTRSLILQLARENSISYQERQLTSGDLVEADEVMLTSTLREVMPVVNIDAHLIGSGMPGLMAFRLRKLLQEYALLTTDDSDVIL